jgi:cell wall assembly regulator SMI1
MESIVDVLAQIDRLLAEQRPDYYARLQPPAGAEQFAAAEHAYGFALPADLKQLYLWKNGQPTTCFKSLSSLNSLMFVALEDALASHQMISAFDQRGEFPAGWWRREWVPLLANGGGDFVCVDAETGGLTWYFHDDAARPAFDSRTIAELLDELLSELEEE